jgi:hypothetical protein
MTVLMTAVMQRSRWILDVTFALQFTPNRGRGLCTLYDPPLDLGSSHGTLIQCLDVRD